jgi:hypothetical protein
VTRNREQLAVSSGWFDSLLRTKDQPTSPTTTTTRLSLVQTLTPPVTRHRPAENGRKWTNEMKRGFLWSLFSHPRTPSSDDSTGRPRCITVLPPPPPSLLQRLQRMYLLWRCYGVLFWPVVVQDQFRAGTAPCQSVSPYRSVPCTF